MISITNNKLTRIKESKVWFLTKFLSKFLENSFKYFKLLNEAIDSINFFVK